MASTLKKRLLWGIVLFTWGTANLPFAQAHLMSAGNGAIQFRDSDAVVLIAVPVFVLHGVDDNADGLLQDNEIKLHREEILAQLANGFAISVGDKQGRPKEALLMSSVHIEDRPGSPQVEWWSLWDFGENPWGNPCTKIRINWFQSVPESLQDWVYSVQVRIGAQSEMVQFSEVSKEQTFLCQLDPLSQNASSP